MRIAICFSGQMRTGVQAAPNIKRYIGDLEPVCDYFVHTWDHQSLPNLAKELTPIDNSVFSEFYKLYNPISMTVEPYAARRAPDNLWGGYRVDPATGKKYVSMFESIYKANRLKKTYEEDIGFVYDYVVRIRTDLIFHQDKSLRADIGDLFSKTMIAPDGDNEFMTAYHKGFSDKLEDIFWIAKSSAMDKLAGFCEFRANSNSEDDWQAQMANWVKDDLKLVYHGLQNSNIKLMRVGHSNLDPMNYDGIPAD